MRLRILPLLRINVSILIVFSILLTACDVGFTPDIEPLVIEEMGEQTYSEDIQPQASPVPIAPYTPSPSLLFFHGADDLDCGVPMVDDNDYGYCKIPGTHQYYVWVPCIESCPESPYYGEQVKLVEDPLLLDEYRLLIDHRDSAKSTRNDKIEDTVLIGIGDFVVGALTYSAACVVTGGGACVAWVIGIGIGLYSALDAGSEAVEEVGIMNNNEDAAQQLFENFPEAIPSLPTGSP